MKSLLPFFLAILSMWLLMKLATADLESNTQQTKKQSKSTEFNIYRGLDANSHVQAVYIKKSEDVYHVGDLVAVTQTGLVDQNRQGLTRWVVLDEFVTTDCFIDDH